LDPSTGALEFFENTAGSENPSFLTFHPNGRFLYAVNESASGLVSAFSLDPSSGHLTFLNWQSSRGDFPCHLATDREGKFLFVANFGSGSVVVYALEADGRIGATLQTIQHQGKGVAAARAEGPHPHCVTVSENNRFVLCCDLGLDKVIVYQFDPDSGRLTPSSEAALTPGAGPRHLAFHPTEKYAYVINELDSSMTVFAYAAKTGSLTELQTLSTLPEGYSDPNAAAEVCVHPSGQYVYGSNRGHDSLVVYKVDDATGKLTLVEHTPTQGKAPRNFAISPTGTWLLAGNQNSNTVTSFQLDPGTGRLTYLDKSIEPPQPVCLKFWISDKLAQ
jgi:6-phosphogluconolactonase